MRHRCLESYRFPSGIGKGAAGLRGGGLLASVGLLVLLAACGSVKRQPGEDAGPPGNSPPVPSSGIISGAGRLTSATFTLDVEIGHLVSQQPATSSTYRIEGNSAIRP